MFKYEQIFSNKMTIAHNISHGTFPRYLLTFRPWMSQQCHFRSLNAQHLGDTEVELQGN